MPSSLPPGALREKAQDVDVPVVAGHRILWLTVFVVGLLLGVAYLALHALSVRALSHDDSISLLAATAHQAAYEQSAPAGRWVPAAEWQAFWSHDAASRRPGAWRTIARDLAAYDIHPPLYFWLRDRVPGADYPGASGESVFAVASRGSGPVILGARTSSTAIE